MHINKKLSQLALLCLFLCSWPDILFSAETDTASVQPVEKSAQPAPGEENATLIELYSWATILPKQLIDLQNQLNKNKEFSKVEEELPKVESDVTELRWDTTMAMTNPEIQTIELAGYQTRVSKVAQRLEMLGTPITSAVTSLTAARKEWQDKNNQVEEIGKRDDLMLAITADDQKALKETIDKALELLDERLKQALSLGKKVGDMQVTVYSIDKDLQSLADDLRAISIQQTSPSMFSYEFYTRLRWDILKRSFANTKRYIVDQLTLIRGSAGYILLFAVGLTLLSMLVKRTQRVVPDSSRWQSFAQCPIATALFSAVSLYTVTNLLPLHSASFSERWDSLLHLLLLTAVMRLIPFLVETPWKKQALKVLTFFMLLTLFFIALGLPQILIHLYVFYVSFAALIIYLYKLLKTRGESGLQMWVSRLWGLFPAIIVISGIGGYDQFAVLAFSTVLSTCIACLIIWVLYQLNLAVLSLLLNIVPITLLQENRRQIIQSLQPVISWLHIFLLIAAEAVIWDFYPTINEAFSGLGAVGFNIGELHISPGFIFIVILVFYGALLTSRATQVLLLQNVLPRYAAEKGVQLSITRLAHYAILTIGFFVMLNVLGFELKQLTILGGALGVGIGFGLQAIVNNFASGLILLFERPIKVGDTIQLGTDFGEVKKLGLRATIIQTFDNAEIVVPNSDLITSQVTNWTLAERKVRVRIPVGVAYGSDIQKVLDILLSCANGNPMVMSSPKPNAFFLAFGASSLDFELRVWIPEFLDNVQVKSDLNQEIESEFAANNIEIPFPQQDLHLRSVDSHVFEGLVRESPEPSVKRASSEKQP